MIAMRALLIPVKDPAHAKTRLSDLLSTEERSRLAWAMFEDVSRCVSETREPDRVVLVSSYKSAIERAQSLGWDVLIEESQESESASVDWASSILRDRGFDIVMRLPADIPLVRAEDIDQLMKSELVAPAAVIVPSREGTGTNAIIRTPPDLFPSRFGPNSLALHHEEAAQAGIECIVIKNERIAFDVDDPSDIAFLLEHGHGTEAFRLLDEIKVSERISATERKTDL
jgi:2-phospho-L-lactate guanylyltransferase